MFVLILLSLVLVGCGCCDHLAINRKRAPFIAVSLIIVVLYVSALMQFLASAPYIILIFSFGCLVFYFSSQRRAGQLLSALLSLSGIIFLLAASLLYFKVRHAHFSTWDEFTHWGAISKYMFLTHGLVTANSPIQMKDYPPGAALFHYFIFKVMGYSEGHAYFAQDLLLIAPLACLFQKITWRKWPYIISTVVFCYLIIFVFGHWSLNSVSGGQGGFVSLFMDLVLGVFFGCGLVAYFFSKKDLKSIFYLVPIVFCLPLLKISGIFFAILVTVIIVTDQFILFFSHKQSVSLKKVLMVLALLSCSFLLSSISWKMYLNVQHIRPTYSSGFSVTHLKQVFSGRLTGQQKSVISDFKTHIKNEKIGAATYQLFLKKIHSVTLMEVLMFLLIVLIIALAIEKDKLKRLSILNVNVWLLLGLLLYLCGLFFVYLFSFKSYESAYISSYSRYLGGYFIGWFIVNYAFFLEIALKDFSSWFRKVGVFIIPIACIIVFPKISYSFLLNPVQPILPVRTNIKKMVKYINSKIPDNKSMYVIWQSSPGFIQNILAFEMIPRKINYSAWSIGKKYPGYDVWTTQIAGKNLLNKISNYHYLFLAKTDKQFWNTYGDFLGLQSYKNQCVKSSCMFVVTKRQNTPVIFQKISNIKITING